jgi:hypothetical protein
MGLVTIIPSAKTISLYKLDLSALGNTLKRSYIPSY